MPIHKVLIGSAQTHRDLPASAKINFPDSCAQKAGLMTRHAASNHQLGKKRQFIPTAQLLSCPSSRTFGDNSNSGFGVVAEASVKFWALKHSGVRNVRRLPGPGLGPHSRCLEKAW